MDVQEVVVTGARMARRSELGDYKLYTLPEATTIAARQVKQVRFLDQRAVPVERLYKLRLSTDGDEQVRFPTILLRAQNTRAAGLGEPLPAGNVVVMEPGRAGGVFYVGEAESEDTPVGLPVELVIGAATDLAVQQTVTAETKLPGDRVRRAYELTLTNAKLTPAQIELRASARPGLRVVQEDARHTTKDGAPLWTLTLRPGERRTFRYAVESEA
jgi:hypothetical protein